MTRGRITSIDTQSKKMPESESVGCKFWTKRRYLVCIFTFLGYALCCALRNCLSVAIVAMTTIRVHTENNASVTYEPEFNWDTKMQGFVLSAFYYGYIVTQIIGGYLSARFGGKLVFGTSAGITAFLTLITPISAIFSPYALIAVRVLVGLIQGAIYPCIQEIMSKWAPPMERNRMVTICYSGHAFGNLITMFLSGFLADLFGWQSIFYFFGALSMVWTSLWFFMVASNPELDRSISDEELRYISESLSKSSLKKSTSVPWGSILTSVPVWALYCILTTANWTFTTFLTQLPKFMSDVMKFDIFGTGMISAVPYIIMPITTQVSGQLADYFQRNKYLTTIQIRKGFTCTSCILQFGFLLGAVYLMEPIGTTVCLSFFFAALSFEGIGYNINSLDLSPQYASIIMGVGNTIGSSTGIITPILTGYLVTDGTAEQWQLVFFITCGINLFGCVVYGIFASSKLQDW